MNLYTYAKNPISWIDPKGLHSSWKYLPIHQAADTLAFGGEISADDLAIINEAQIDADSKQFQSPDINNTIRHAMSAPGVSPSEACKKANEWIRRQFEDAWALEDVGRHTDSLIQFTYALHALQDATAPGHTNFQVWDGHYTKEHIEGDIQISSLVRNSNLIRATRKAFEWFRDRKLPDTANLFMCQCEDPPSSPSPSLPPGMVDNPQTYYPTGMTLGDIFSGIPH